MTVIPVEDGAVNDDDKLLHVVREALAEVAPGAPVDDLDPDLSFRDQMEMDSMDFLDFVAALETRLAVKIPEEKYPLLSSPRGCVEYLRQAA